MFQPKWKMNFPSLRRRRKGWHWHTILSFSHLSLSFLSLCLSEQRGGMCVCPTPGALTMIWFRSGRSCEREKCVRTRTRAKRGRRKDEKIKMHKQEKNVSEGLLWYRSLEALLNAGRGWSLARVRGYHGCMFLLHFPNFSLFCDWQITGRNSCLQQTIKVLFLGAHEF